MILMSSADNAHKMLFLAVVFFILDCLSVQLIDPFYPHQWLYQLKEATKPCVTDRSVTALKCFEDHNAKSQLDLLKKKCFQIYRLEITQAHVKAHPVCALSLPS